MSRGRHLSTEIAIKASAETVWRHLTDFGSFPQWNPFIRRAAGPLEPGTRIEVVLELGSRPRKFRPTVTVVEAPRELRWLARVGFPRVFDVERVFQIVPAEPGYVQFRQSETCTGILAPVLFAGGRLERDILAGYAALNDALRLRAERDDA